MFFPVATFKFSYLSSLVMSSILLGFCGLQHEAAWGFEMVCHQGMCLAKDFLVFDIRYSQTCISKDSILFGAKQSFALVVFITLSRFLV